MSKRKCVWIAALSILSFMVNAQMADREIDTCEIKENPWDLTLCRSKAEEKVSAEEGKWITSRKTILFSSNFQVKLMASSPQGIYLAASCDTNNKLRIFIDWQQAITDKQSISVTYQTDKETATTSQWDVAEDQKVTFAKKPGFILQKLMESNQFTALINNTQTGQITATFNTQKAVAALAEADKKCGNNPSL